MPAEAYHSMTDAHGQHSHVSGAPSQVLVDRESRRRARFVAPSRLPRAGGGGNFPDRGVSFSAQTKGTVRLVNAFYVTYGPQTIDFAIFVSMNPPTMGAPMGGHGGSNPDGGLWGPPLGSDRPWLVFFLAREGVEPDAVFLTLRFLNGAP